MNWIKIFIYIGILYLATFTVGFVFGFIQADVTGENALILTNLGLILSMLTACIWVFAHLAINLQEKIFLHALCVGVGSWIISFPINVIMLSHPISQWFSGGAFILITLSIGTLIGTNKKHQTK